MGAREKETHDIFTRQVVEGAVDLDTGKVLAVELQPLTLRNVVRIEHPLPV